MSDTHDKIPSHMSQNHNIPKWHDYFLQMVDVVKIRSPDLNTKVGCVIVGDKNQVLSTGYNGMPFGVEATPERLERPAKYIWTEHGDRNAIYLAARSGVALEGA